MDMDAGLADYIYNIKPLNCNYYILARGTMEINNLYFKKNKKLSFWFVTLVRYTRALGPERVINLQL